jgi:hypothetical protein
MCNKECVRRINFRILVEIAPKAIHIKYTNTQFCLHVRRVRNKVMEEIVMEYIQ